jgi:hypothetical protein
LSDATTRNTRTRPPLGLLVVGTCAAAQLVVSAFRIATYSNPMLLRRFMTDDAFYYFDIARRFPHVAASPGVTTTGFHPLYWLTLIPIFRVTHGFAAVRVALVMLLIVHIVAGFLLYRLLCRTWSTRTAAFVAAAWMASAGLRTVVLLGVETAWVELALIGLLLACTSDKPTATMAPRVGAMLAICYLARNDAIVIAGAVVLAWLWARRPSPRSIAALAGSALVLASPWLVFLATHHSLAATDSARALHSLRLGHGLISVFRSIADLVAARTASLVLDHYVANPGAGAALVVAAFAVAIVAGIVFIKKTAWSPYDIALVVSVPVLFVAYGIRLGGVREWYLVSINVAVFAVLLPPLFELILRLARHLVHESATPPRARYAVATLGIAVGVVASFVAPFGEQPQEAMKYTAATRAAPRLATQRVAAFNSGIFAFVLDDSVVDNLDGVVNPLVQPHLRNKTLCAYLRQRQIRWFIDDARSAQLLVTLGGPSGRRQILVAAQGPKLPAEVLVRFGPNACGAGRP